jgi:hypothetical protein
VHDRKDLRLAVELALDRAVVGEETRDVGILAERERLARPDERVDLAAREQLSE